MVPRGEVADLSPEQSGSAQCDTTACAACRGEEASEVHPTCDACGSCDACDCHAGPVIDRRYVPMDEEPRDCLGLALHGRSGQGRNSRED